jgi:hypothetical protein
MQTENEPTISLKWNYNLSFLPATSQRAIFSISACFHHIFSGPLFFIRHNQMIIFTVL